MDLYNVGIISYTISEHPNLLMIMNMVDKAFKGLNKKCGLILHTDQGALSTCHLSENIERQFFRECYEKEIVWIMLS